MNKKVSAGITREKFYSMVPSLEESWSLVACLLCGYELLVNFFFFKEELFKGSMLPETKFIYVQIQCYFSRDLGYHCSTKYMAANRNGCFLTYHVLFVTSGL